MSTEDRYELLIDTGGPGKFRGGLGTRRDVCILAQSGKLAGRGLRETVAAPGLFGGSKGKVGSFVLHPDSNHEVKLPGSFSEYSVESGSIIRVDTPSGAGYGDPLNRDPANVLNDVINGKVSSSGAEKDYGVVIKGRKVDKDSTQRMRNQLGIEHG